MRVLITGGAGLVGKSTTERLVQEGWDVRVIGIEPPMQIAGAEYIPCDILDYPLLREQMRGCQVVIHLAAIRDPRSAPGQTVFQVNAAGTFNVFEAAADEGIKRIVQASSINALGCAWNIADTVAHYFPIDEDHPTATTDPYSFSKNIIEDIGDYYWRREGISSIAVRLPGVWQADRINLEQFRQYRARMSAFLDELVNQPEDQRLARLAAARQQALEFRGQRSMEYAAAQKNPPRDFPPEDLLWQAYTIDRFNFWAFVDERDSAQALVKGLTADFEGSHPLFVNAEHNWLGYDSQTLARLFFPDVSEWKQPVRGADTLVSIAKARALIGFEPEYSME